MPYEPSSPKAAPPRGDGSPVEPSERIERRTTAHHALQDVPDDAPEPRITRRRSPLRLGAIVVCGAVLVFSAVSLIRYGLDYTASQTVSEELRTLYHAEEDAAPEETEAPALTTPELTAFPAATEAPATAAPAAALSSAARTTTAPYAAAGNPDGKFSALQKKNKEILGWLTIPGVVDEPVVKRDNTFYLTHDALGKTSATGALFLDASCALYPAPENLVIHGHNMKTGAMFGSLKKYKVKGAAFLQEAGLVQFDTVFEEATYAVFAVVTCDVRPSQRTFLNFSGLLSFSTDEDFTRYVERVRSLSMVRVPLEVLPSDRLLTLSTCAGDNENERLLIICRKLREGESQLDLNYAFAHAVDQ